MNLNEKNLELQVQIWALIGPVIALATVITLYFQGASQNIVLSLAVLLGTLGCWWWKTKGLIGSLVGILLLGAYQFLNNPSEDPLWNVGITFAIALTFLVTALSFEEVEAIVDGIQSESSSRLKSLLKLDEKLERVQSKLQEEKKALLQTVKERENELQERHALLEISRDEIITTHRRHEELLSEIYSLKMQHEKERQFEIVETSEESQRQMEELRLELTFAQDQLAYETAQYRKELEQHKADLLRSKNLLLENAGHSEIELAAIKTQLAQSKDELRITVDRANTELSRLKNELAQQAEQAKFDLELQKEEFETAQKLFHEKLRDANTLHIQLAQQVEQTKFELELQKDELETSKKQLVAAETKILEANNVQSECVHLKNELSQAKQLQEQLQAELANAKECATQTESLKAEIAALQDKLQQAGTVNAAEAESRELRRINGMYSQLRIQFEEKSEILDAARRELFAVQERLNHELMEQKERQYEGSEFEKELQRCLDEMEYEQRQLVKAHQREVEDLQDLISQMMCAT